MTKEQREQLETLLSIYKCAEIYIKSCLEDNIYNEDYLIAVANSTNYLAMQKLKNDCNR